MLTLACLAVQMSGACIVTVNTHYHFILVIFLCVYICGFLLLTASHTYFYICIFVCDNSNNSTTQPPPYAEIPSVLISDLFNTLGS